jgi:hypothetical protein
MVAGSQTGLPISTRAQTAIEPVNPLERQDWDEWILGHPDASFFHGRSWAKVLEEACGARPLYLAAGQDWVGLLALMEVRSSLTGLRGVSLPFTDLCPPLADEAREGALGPARVHAADAAKLTGLSNGVSGVGVTAQQLLQRAVELGRQRGWRYLECRGGSFPGATPSLAYFEHSLDLTRGEQGLFAGFDGSARRAVRKAERLGVRTEVSTSSDALRTFYQLHCRTRRRHGVPPQPYRFFECIDRYVLQRKQGFVVVGRHNGRAIAGAVFLHLGDRALFKYGASLEGYRGLRGNNLVMWTAIRWLAAHGFRTLHFGRTSLNNEGLRQFKRIWGTTERRVEYVKFDFGTGHFVADHDRAHGWHTHFLRWLPVPVLRLVGAVLYRHLA